MSLGERQTIVRQLVDRIELHIEGTSERGKVVVHWAGGHHSVASFVRPVARTEQLSYHKKLLERIRRLREEKLTSVQIAERLNTEGWRPPKRRTSFNAGMVRTIMSRAGMTLQRPAARRVAMRPKIQKDEWLLPDLAAELAMPVITLYFGSVAHGSSARTLTNSRASARYALLRSSAGDQRSGSQVRDGRKPLDLGLSDR